VRFAYGRAAAVAAGFAISLFVVPPAFSQLPFVALRRILSPPTGTEMSYDFSTCANEAASLSARFGSLASRCDWPEPRGVQDPIQVQLHALGTAGVVIERARQRVIEILRDENPCSAWFQEFDSDPASTFESLHFMLDDSGPKSVLALKTDSGDRLLKHPYSAGVQENAGKGAVLWLNANGAFFARTAEVLELENSRGPARPIGHRVLRVGSYEGSTLRAQVATLLHELGHVTGSLPDDSDELSGESGRNTDRVLRVCRAEIKASGQQRHGKPPK
jgi:hypothetical protein